MESPTLEREAAINRHAPLLTVEQILLWADAHRARTGRWPHAGSGVVFEAPGDTWSAINMALRRGYRGLPKGSTLAQLLGEFRAKEPGLAKPTLCVEHILVWAEAHRRRMGKWPSVLSGAVWEAAGESWRGIDTALRNGFRGLPAGDSLARLLRRYQTGNEPARDRRAQAAGTQPREGGQGLEEPERWLFPLRGQVSERKWRLFACACARQMWWQLTDERSRRAVETAERFADGSAGEDELQAACRDAQEARQAASGTRQKAAWAAACAAAPVAWKTTPLHMALTLVKVLRTGREAELLRCLFDDRPVSFPPAVLSWNAGAVVQCARAAYENRTSPPGTLDNAHLAKLADALEAAGWGDGALLAHLRSSGEHYRGCIVVDTVLARR